MDDDAGIGPVGRAALWAAVTAVLGAGGYLVLVYPPSLIEFPMALAAGVISGAAVGSLVAMAAPGWGRPTVGVRPVRLVWQLLSGFGRACAAVGKRGPVRGELVRSGPDGAPARDDPAKATDAAITGWTRSLAADSYVTAFGENGSRVEHRLRSGKD